MTGMDALLMIFYDLYPLSAILHRSQIQKSASPTIIRKLYPALSFPLPLARNSIEAQVLVILGAGPSSHI